MIQFILTPILGGVIGYFTNDLAIRMLFRPHKAKYIGRIHIPFTPGLIPKEKSRIANAIGEVVSTNLMSDEVLDRYLQSPEMVTKVREAAASVVGKLQSNTDTLQQFLCKYINEEDLDTTAKSINKNLSLQVSRKLNDPNLADQIAHAAVESVIDNLMESDTSSIIESIGQTGMLATIGRRLIGRVLSLLQEPTERLLRSSIGSMMQNEGTAIASNMIGSETERILQTPVCKLLEGKDELIAKVPDTVERLYKMVIDENLTKALESIDISKIVRDRINEMDVAETEELIMQIMHKELKAIVWLGALLGFLIGCLNLLIM